MNAIELADMLVSKEVLLVNDQVCEAAALLRRQHEAIKQLREAVQFLIETSSYEAEVLGEQALKDTEGL